MATHPDSLRPLAPPPSQQEQVLQALRSQPLYTSPVLRDLTENAVAERIVTVPSFGEQVAAAIDKRLYDFADAGLIFRTTTGKVRRIRLPARPGDLTVVVTFGAPVDTGEPGPTEEDKMRTELINAALGCAGAVIGWVGLVAGAFVAGPGGWVAMGIVAFDGIAANAGTVSCMLSGIRYFNFRRGRGDINQRMDDSRAYRNATRTIDGIALASGPRVVYTSAREIGAAGRAALAAAQGTNAVARAGNAVEQVAKEILITRPLQLELLGVVGAGIGVAGSLNGGILKELRDVTPVLPDGTTGIAMPWFSVALTN